MKMWKIFLCHVYVCLHVSRCIAFSCDKKKIPEGFRFGISTSAYQIEGGWDADGRGETIWDYLTHNKKYLIKDQSNGDIACNSYYLYKRDVEMLSDLGIDFYRFSVSWSRILPTGFPHKVNEKGVEYYNKLINELLENNIIPVITIYHSDLPQRLQELGGWTNPYIIEWYSDFARICYERFGDRVKNWVTINEPHQICFFGYGSKLAAPMLDMSGIAEYLCAKNIIFAHAKAYYIYDEEFRSSQRGSVGLVIASNWAEPKTSSQDDVEAAQDLMEFNSGLYINPIFSKDGDYPEVVKKRIAAKSKQQGFPRSRLPPLNSDDIEYLKGTADFYGLNHYTTEYISRYDNKDKLYPSPSFLDDCGISISQPDSWKISETSLTKSAPWGFYKVLQRVKDHYNNPGIIIFENGYANSDGKSLNDTDRVTYLRSYMCSMLNALEDGCDIRGYGVWSVMDNFEWKSGYTYKFGLYRVDMKSPNRTRTPRLSAYVYREILRSRTLDYSYQPDVS